MTNGSLIKTNRFADQVRCTKQIGNAMPAKLPPENFDVISVEQALKHPSFSGNVRDLILAVTERADTITLAELAECAGSDARTIGLRLIGELVMSEVVRIAALDRTDRSGLN